MNASPQETPDRFIRVPEAARLIGCCKRIVWELLSTEKLMRYKVLGRRITVLSFNEVSEYIESSKALS
jgi:predicted DNA-binding transcriptional regulator AlpA